MKKGFLALFLVAFAAITCWGQSTFKPKFERQPWDTYVGVKGGAIYSNLTALHGEAKITGMGGIYTEAFLTKSFAIQTELTFSHHGSHNAISLPSPEAGATFDYRLNYINTDFLFKQYIADRLGLYAGIHAAYAVTMECNGKSIKKELYRSDVTIPVGACFVWHNVSLDARYQYPFRKLAKTDKAKAIMGNSRNSSIILTLGYRFRVF